MRMPQLTALNAVSMNSGDGFGAGDVDGVAANGFILGGVGPIGHEALCVGRDHPILRRNEIPRRLRPPCRFVDLPRKHIDAPRHLRVGHERGDVGVDVCRERRGELLLVEEEEAVLGWQDRWHGCAGWRVGDERVHRLAAVGSER